MARQDPEVARQDFEVARQDPDVARQDFEVARTQYLLDLLLLVLLPAVRFLLRNRA